MTAISSNEIALYVFKIESRVRHRMTEVEKEKKGRGLGGDQTCRGGIRSSVCKSF